MASKVKIRINSNDKIEELLQETYNQACEQLTQVQEEMNKITKSTKLVDLTIDEKSKYAKIMHDYSGDKDRAIRAKMDIAKLLIEIVNHRGRKTIPEKLIKTLFYVFRDTDDLIKLCIPGRRLPCISLRIGDRFYQVTMDPGQLFCSPIGG